MILDLPLLGYATGSEDGIDSFDVHQLSLSLLS